MTWLIKSNMHKMTALLVCEHRMKYGFDFKQTCDDLHFTSITYMSSLYVIQARQGQGCEMDQTRISLKKFYLRLLQTIYQKALNELKYERDIIQRGQWFGQGLL